MSSTTWVPNQYPPTRRSEHVDVYESASRGKVAVPDPYQWLETDSDETDKWTSAQETFTRDYLDRNPDLEKLRIAFRDCINYPNVCNFVPNAI
jgi:prolyl oligopeptidase